MDIEQLKHFNDVYQAVTDDKIVNLSERLAQTSVKIAGIAKLHPDSFIRLEAVTNRKKFDLLRKLFEASVKEDNPSHDEVYGILEVPGIGKMRIRESIEDNRKFYALSTAPEVPANDPNFIEIAFPGYHCDDFNIPLSSIRLMDVEYVHESNAVYRQPEEGSDSDQELSMREHGIYNLAHSIEAVDTLEHIARAVGINPDEV